MVLCLILALDLAGLLDPLPSVTVLRVVLHNNSGMSSIYLNIELRLGFGVTYMTSLAFAMPVAALAMAKANISATVVFDHTNLGSSYLGIKAAMCFV